MSTFVWADSPPDWRTNYTIESMNKKFTAEISPVRMGAKEKPWEWKYQIVVNETGKKLPQIWKKEYFHTGYSDGMLSNDGKYFVYIEFWYYSTGDLITVYSSKYIKGWNASDLSVSSWWLTKTVSHKLWLSDDNSPEFIEKDGKTIGLRIFTVKGQRKIFF